MLTSSLPLSPYLRNSYDVNYPMSSIHRLFGNGITESVRELRRILYGPNQINVPVKNPISLLLDEVLHPFYIFQIFSVFVWLADDYYIYATVIAVTSSFSALLSLVETRRNRMRLREMAKFTCTLQRYTRGNLDCPENVSSADLVPGDLIIVPDDFVMPCDVALLSGQCIVNESMLTGESIPVVKNPIPINGERTPYSVDDSKAFTLYAGTKVIQTRQYAGNKVVGLVCRTSFSTAKGKLMLSILFPKPSTFKFYQDSFKFIGVLFVVGIMGFMISAVQLIRLRVPVKDIILRALDVITITVPPALPVAMTVGTSFAIARLKRRKIFCISPPRINISGRLKLMCFDKTGTLTEDGLDLYGIRPTIPYSSSGNSIPSQDDRRAARRFGDMYEAGSVVTELYNDHNMQFKLLASCHSLTYVRDELVGDPLELKIFEATGWKLKEPKPGDYQFELAIPTVVYAPTEAAPQETQDMNDPASLYNDGSLRDILPPTPELGIIRKFEFMSALQRMSVIVKDLNANQTIVFVKGSPEKLRDICRPQTIPGNFSEVLYSYAHEGFRVLGCGFKILKKSSWRKVQKLQREEVESDLCFLGLIVMQNKLKSDTTRIIRTLRRANVRNVMVTGDNPYTAVSVARQCYMIPPQHRVYLGHVVDSDTETVPFGIRWRDIDNDDELDGKTFRPIGTNYDPTQQIELAITGDVFEKLIDGVDDGDVSYLALFHKVLVGSQIFSRMSPDQKMRLVEELQKIGYFVGMCGDGANDCGALKAAHVGISLSEAEASIAAPFTSLRPTIACVPTVIKEGRAALTTSFQMFKYMATYSFIQFASVIILYMINSNIGDVQFLYVDLFVIFPTSMLMGKTEAAPKMSKQKPLESLISRFVFASLIGQFILVLLFDVFVWFDVRSQPWYRPLHFSPHAKENIVCYETTSLFLLSSFQVLNTVVAYSISKPFKKPLYTNKFYMTSLVMLYSLTAYLTIIPDKYTMSLVELIALPMSYKLKLLAIAALHFVLSWAFEFVMIKSSFGKRLLKSIRFKKKTRKMYNSIRDRFRQEQAETRPLLAHDIVGSVSNDDYCSRTDSTSPTGDESR